MAAINTGISGILALLHNSGLPDRYRWDRNEFNKLEEHIKTIVDTGLVPAGHSTNDVLGECFEMYAVATQVRSSSAIFISFYTIFFHLLLFEASFCLLTTKNPVVVSWVTGPLLSWSSNNSFANSLINGQDRRKECSEHVRTSHEPEAFYCSTGAYACETISQDRFKDVIAILVGLVV